MIRLQSKSEVTDLKKKTIQTNKNKKLLKIFMTYIVSSVAEKMLQLIDKKGVDSKGN